jgi:hypothetical protein
MCYFDERLELWFVADGIDFFVDQIYLLTLLIGEKYEI